MNIFITGGTGFVGQGFLKSLARGMHHVAILTRGTVTSSAWPNVSYIKGDPTRPGDWQEAASEARVIINLAGESIFQRWTEEAKWKIERSRLESTRNVVDALFKQPGEGKILLNASAIGYYGPRGDEDLDETAAPGHDFLADLGVRLEQEALRAESAGVRVCLMRFGIVLGPDGGALKVMTPPFRFGLGGRLGTGKQWFSWVHRDDVVKAALFLMNHETARGPFNFTAPNPVRNRELTQALGRVMHRPALLAVPGFALKLAMGEMADVVLAGQRVIPKKLLELGFRFEFPNLDAALANALAK